jgi:hypothetical protein
MASLLVSRIVLPISIRWVVVTALVAALVLVIMLAVGAPAAHACMAIRQSVC